MPDDEGLWCGILRCFVEAESTTAAQPIAAQLKKLLERFVAPTLQPIERYAKIPAYQEVCFTWSTKEPEALQTAIQAALGPDWHRLHETDAVWDFRLHAPLVFSEIRWAQLEHFLCSAVVKTNDTSN